MVLRGNRRLLRMRSGKRATKMVEGEGFEPTIFGTEAPPRRWGCFHSLFRSRPPKARPDLFPSSGFIPLSATPAARIWIAARVPAAGDPSGVSLAQPQRASRRRAQRAPVDPAEAVASVANTGSRLLSSSNTGLNHQTRTSWRASSWRLAYRVSRVPHRQRHSWRLLANAANHAGH